MKLDSDGSGALDTKLTVLWLARGLGPGGMENLLLTHARLGDHDRFRYIVAYVTEEPFSLAPQLIEEGVAVVALGESLLGVLSALRQLCLRERVDVVHAHSPVLAVVARLVVRTIRPRPLLLSTEHNSWESYRLPTRIANAVTFPLDDVHLAVSSAAATSSPGWWAHPTPQVVTHGAGTTTGDTRSPVGASNRLRDELGILPDELMVVCVANHRPEKDYDNLLQAVVALRAVADQTPGLRSIRIVAAGSGPLLDRNRTRVTELGLDATLELLGHRNDVSELLAVADGFLLASRHEGLPVALMEATKAGLPVISTAVGGIPEVLSGDAGALLVPPSDPTALAGALSTFASDAGLRERMSAASLDASDQFDGQPAVDLQEALYARMAR